MIGKQYRNLAAALMVAAGLGLAGHAGSTANAQPETAGCSDPAMMGDQMHDPAMMGDQMRDPAMMGDQMHDPAMMGDDQMHDPAMMGDQMLQARDGQCLAGQTLSVRAAFAAAWGDHAGARWAAEHEAELARLGR